MIKHETQRERYVGARDVAAHLGVALKTIYNMRASGRIPAHYLPGSSRPRYKISEVERVMSCRRPRRRGAGAKSG